MIRSMRHIARARVTPHTTLTARHCTARHSTTPYRAPHRDSPHGTAQHDTARTHARADVHARAEIGEFCRRPKRLGLGIPFGPREGAAHPKCRSAAASGARIGGGVGPKCRSAAASGAMADLQAASLAEALAMLRGEHEKRHAAFSALMDKADKALLREGGVTRHTRLVATCRSCVVFLARACARWMPCHPPRSARRWPPTRRAPRPGLPLAPTAPTR